MDDLPASSAEVKWVELYLSSPYMLSWCGQGELYIFLVPPLTHPRVGWGGVDESNNPIHSVYLN